jgi:YfiH family protein
VLGVLTADCGPLLLADAHAGVIGAAHAGWKGALGGIVESAVAAMTGLGADPRRIMAALGPCIAQPSYEVGPEFVARFAGTDGASAACFTPAPGHVKALFDLKGYVASRLRRAGVERIEVLPHDTCADAERFFSFRRTTIRGEERFGLQLSGIVLPA